jgi:hypothetical protein
MSTALIPNIVLGVSVFAVIVVAAAWAIGTAHRDYDHALQAGGRSRRSLWWPRAGSRAN